MVHAAKLKTLILRELQISPRSGYGLVKSIHEKTGWKPSFGSIYPALEALAQEGLAEYEEDGRKKRYTITKKGRKESLKDDGTLERLKEDMKLMAHLCGADEKTYEALIEQFIEAIKRGEKPLEGLERSTTKLNKEFWRLQEEGKITQERDRINKILDETTKRLERL